MVGSDILGINLMTCFQIVIVKDNSDILVMPRRETDDGTEVLTEQKM